MYYVFVTAPISPEHSADYTYSLKSQFDPSLMSNIATSGVKWFALRFLTDLGVAISKDQGSIPDQENRTFLHCLESGLVFSYLLCRAPYVMLSNIHLFNSRYYYVTSESETKQCT